MRRALAGADWIDPLALSQSASHLAEADGALERIAARMWDREASVAAARIAVPVADAIDISARLVGRAIAVLTGKNVSRGEVASFLKTLDKRGNIGGILVEKQRAIYVCSPEPPRRAG